MSIDFMLAPLRDADGRITQLISSAIDITARTGSERRLRESEARFRRVLDSTADGLVQIDEDGRIVLANRRVESMFGYTQDELHRVPVETLMPARHRDAHPTLRQSFFNNPATRDMAQRRELYARRKDGSEFPVEIGLNPVHTPEGMHVLATIVDVTVRYEARRALERALEEKTVLLNEVHHRVKNNLQVISSLLNMQARRAPPEVRACARGKPGTRHGDGADSPDALRGPRLRPRRARTLPRPAVRAVAAKPSRSAPRCRAGADCRRANRSASTCSAPCPAACWSTNSRPMRSSMRFPAAGRAASKCVCAGWPMGAARSW